MKSRDSLKATVNARFRSGPSKMAAYDHANWSEINSQLPEFRDGPTTASMIISKTL